MPVTNAVRTSKAVLPRRQGTTELLVLVVFFLAYRQIRGMAPARVGLAHHNAGLLIQATPDTVRHLESWSVSLLATHHWLREPLLIYYNGLHMPLTAAILVLLWRRTPESYRAARSVLVGATSIALVAFWAFPVAPPRLAGTTIGADEPDIWWLPVRFVNDYAAFPSLHIAWACWSAWAFCMVVKASAARLAYAYPLITSAVLVATGNHYVLDLVAGAATFVLAYVVVRTSRSAAKTP